MFAGERLRTMAAPTNLSVGSPFLRREDIMRKLPAAFLAGLAILAGLLALLAARAETCLSPFVKHLERPEQLLYVFCVDADARDNDFLAVIDVKAGSSRYGQILYQLDLGSRGNETHHFGFTDDRTHIWGCSLFSNRVFIIDVASNPSRPKLEKVIDSAQDTGLTGPHSPYALPGRMLISYLGAKGGGLPAGLAEFSNEGSLIRTLPLPREAPYGYDVAINPDLNRMVTSSFTPPENYRKPLARMDLQHFGNKLLVWDFRARKVLQTLTTGAAPLECRWSRQEGARHGYCNCALEDTLWIWEEGKDGRYSTRKLCQTGKMPVDLSQSPDGKYIYVSCFASDEIQQWDVSDVKKPRLASKLRPGVQPNMMHTTGDGKRMYVTNSLLSTMDRENTFWVKLVRIGPNGLKLDPDFHVDLTRLRTGPARGHDMLLY
jgi:selenium-binding protein 1